MRLFSFHKNIYVAGFVSLFMDLSSEMVYPLVPLFLSNVLGVNKALIGLIEGVAESTASVLRIFSGWFSDLIGRRKGVMAAGYAISTLSRPIVALAAGWHTVLAYRFIDRLGKGVRGAPRDAIIAESSERAAFGRAFGFQRSMDTVGAVLGPALAFFLLSVLNEDFRKVFWISIIPGAIAVLLIIFFITEKKRDGSVSAERPRLTLKVFDWRFKFFVLIVTVFSVGNSSDVFLILRAQQLGVPTVMVPVVYMVFNIVYSLTAIPAGMIGDKYGKKRVILASFALFAIVYYGFAAARAPGQAWLLFALYGVFMGLNEGMMKAFLATIIPPDFKATAFGVYNAALGLALLPASLIGGWLWDHVSPAATFYYGAATAALSAILFFVYGFMVKRKKG